MPQTAAVRTLSDQVDQLRKTRGEMIRVEDIADVLAAMAETLRGDLELAAVKIGTELNGLMDFITRAKTEIAAIQPHALSTQQIPGATDELDAIVQNTEEAAGKIMDCAEQLTQLSKSADHELRGKLEDISTRIFEASSFQDITGQRVTKVVRVLKHIEEKLANLAQAVGDVAPAAPQAKPNIAHEPSDKDLLNGPQLAGHGNNQDDIDALLASFD
jgi:chemotaxis protein CheZ